MFGVFGLTIIYLPRPRDKRNTYTFIRDRKIRYARGFARIDLGSQKFQHFCRKSFYGHLRDVN